MTDEDPDETPWGQQPLEVFTSGGVRVMEDRCSTCIFRPGNLMHLREGRVQHMLQEAIAREGHITCHDTLPGNRFGLDPAVCKGMADHPVAGIRSLVLRMGRALKMITTVPVPPPSHDSE